MPIRMNMTMTKSGDRIFTPLMQMFRKGGSETRMFWGGVKGIVWSETGYKFRSLGGAAGWRPLSPVTVKARSHGGSLAMQETGLLMRSITGKRRGSVVIEKTTQLTIGTNLRSKSGASYPRVLQEGRIIKVTDKMRHYMISTHGINLHGKDTIEIPARPFLYIDAKMRKRIEQYTKEHVEQILKSGGEVK